jgi:hypothetical protein
LRTTQAVTEHPRVASSILALGTSCFNSTQERRVEAALFLSLLDSTVGYFEMEMEDPKRRIGFAGPRKNSHV